MAIQKASRKDWPEIRRFQALELKLKGWKQNDIAEALGVTEGAVSQWLTTAQHQGLDALRSQPRSGAPARLTEKQKQLIPDFLAHGAEAYGFRGAVWTCARVASVIEREFGVVYHKDHVSRLLKALDWTPQKPLERAVQRDETLIGSWRVENWETLKKKPKMSSGRLFWWTNPASIYCPVWSRLMRPRAVRRSCILFKLAIISRP
jgi:transposase